MKNERIKTYEAIIQGRKVRVTIPEDPKPEDLLIDAIRENLTPDAVAAMAACLQLARTRDERVNRQIEWFRERLVTAIGGNHILNQTVEDLGL